MKDSFDLTVKERRQCKIGIQGRIKKKEINRFKKEGRRFLYLV